MKAGRINANQEDKQACFLRLCHPDWPAKWHKNATEKCRCTEKVHTNNRVRETTYTHIITEYPYYECSRKLPYEKLRTTNMSGAESNDTHQSNTRATEATANTLYTTTAILKTHLLNAPSTMQLMMRASMVSGT